MKKITELTETVLRPVYYKDAYGNREKTTEEFIGKREVKSIGSGPRLAHFVADLLAFQLVLFIVNYLLELLYLVVNSSPALILTVRTVSNISGFFLYLALYAICEHLWQKTPGKFLTKTIVIDEYGNKPGFGSIILRSIIRFIPFEPLSCIGDKYSRGWHDRWSNTWVVPIEELQTLKKLQSEQSDDAAPSVSQE